MTLLGLLMSSAASVFFLVQIVQEIQANNTGLAVWSALFLVLNIGIVISFMMSMKR